MTDFISNWMTCTCCRAVVQQNNTGICLGCQGGFTGPLEQEKCNIPIETSYKKPDATLRQQNNDANLRQEEQEDAVEERKEPEGNIAEYKDRNGCGETSEASSCDSTECCGQESQKKKKWWKKEEKVDG